jgi:hypothetical protein
MATSDDKNRIWNRMLIATVLVVLATFARFIPHPPNFAPLAAVALFAGGVMTNRWLALALPLAILLLSDSILGMYPDMPIVYLAFALTTMLGFSLNTESQWTLIFRKSMVAALMFFVVTNLGVWAVTGLYPHTREGLRACFIAAVPFFQNTLISTVLFTVMLFACQRLLERVWAARSAAATIR